MTGVGAEGAGCLPLLSRCPLHHYRCAVLSMTAPAPIVVTGDFPIQEPPMKSTFHKVMPAVYRTEGGYIDHPRDPGGATNLGITIATLRKWRGRPVSKQDVRELHKNEASAIYKAWYWDQINLDEMPAGVDWAIFDFSINSGPSRAIKGLQTAVGVKADGVLGPVTMNGVDGRPAKDIIHGITLYRRSFVRRLSNYPTFKKGWERRITRTYDEAISLTGDHKLTNNGMVVVTPPRKGPPVPTYVTPDTSLASRLFKLIKFLINTFITNRK